MPGSRGPTGEKGEPGDRGNDYVDLVKSNWKQCVWKREDDKDSGLIQVLDLEIQDYKYWTYPHGPTLLGTSGQNFEKILDKILCHRHFKRSA